jgi:hypothetical protein
VFAVNDSTTAGSMPQGVADYFVEAGAMIPCADDAINDAWYLQRALGMEGLPPASESLISTYYNIDTGIAPLVDGDVGGGYIHASLTTNDPSQVAPAPAAGPTVETPVEAPPVEAPAPEGG